jgi:F0F1-type ATP synthase membrane subunit b/b'
LDELTGELAEIQQDAERKGQQEKEAVIAASRVEAERLRELSKQEIGLVSQNVKRELRQYAADLATEGARRRLMARMTPKIHAELIDKSIERLGHLYEESGTG